MKPEFGDETHALAVTPREIDPDFRQSAAIRENRGPIQTRLTGGKRKSR